MSTTAPASRELHRGRAFARNTLVLGAASAVLFASEFGLVPFGTYLGVAAAIGSLVYAVRTLQQPHQRGDILMASAGVGLALLTLLAFAFLIVAFIFSPGD